MYLLPGCKSDILFCCSPWKKKWTGKGRPRSVARAARYPQTTDSRQIRWVFFFPAKRIHIYIHIYLYIYIFPIYYWLLFILVYPLFALHFYTYIHRLLITVIVSLICNRRQERRIADETTMYLLQVPLSRNCNYILRCIVFALRSSSWPNHGGSFGDGATRWWRTRLWNKSSVHTYNKRVLRFTRKVRRRSHTHVYARAHARTHAYMWCICVEFTLHVGLLHAPKCFAVCCSPC